MASKVIQIADTPNVGPREPLKGVKESHIRKFYERNGLPIEVGSFVRGVLAFRHQTQILGELEDTPANVDIDMRIGDHQYTKHETEVIRKAWTRNRFETFKNLARLHRLLIVACIYAAMTQGWDQASMAGAAIEVMKDLGRPTSTGPSSVPTRRADETDFSIDLDYNTWLLGITVGVPFFAGAVLGLIVTDPVTSIMGFGRRGAICVAGVFSFLSVIGSASVNKWEHLLGFRILLGAGMAGKASIVPILLSETSPKNIRGMLLVFWQLFVAFGLAAGSVANLSVYSLDTRSSWRYMFISAFIPALLLLSLILFSPESPRWLLKESGARSHSEPGDVSRVADDAPRVALVQEAFKSLIDLRGEPNSILAAGELYLLHWRLVDEQHRLERALSGESSSQDVSDSETLPDEAFFKVVGHIGWWPRMKLMFLHIGFVRRAHLAAFAVMVSQQLCGINLVAFLADTFFRYSIFHHNHETSTAQNVQLLGFSLGLMLLNFLATIPALFIMDRSNGRRRALNWSFPCMAISLLASALLLTSAGDMDHQPSVANIVGHYIFLAMFILAYSIGEGPAAFVISAEVFPLVNRELGMSFAVFWNFMGAGLLAVASPWLLKELDQFGVLLLFAGLNMVAWFLCFWLVPPTGKEDLEDVYRSLEVPLDFMLVYLVKVMVWNTVTTVDFCLRLLIIPWRGFAPWSVCAKRYGLQVKDPVEENADRLRKEKDDTNNSSDLHDLDIPLENLQTGRLGRP